MSIHVKLGFESVANEMDANERRVKNVWFMLWEGKGEEEKWFNFLKRKERWMSEEDGEWRMNLLSCLYLMEYAMKKMNLQPNNHSNNQLVIRLFSFFLFSTLYFNWKSNWIQLHICSNSLSLIQCNSGPRLKVSSVNCKVKQLLSLTIPLPFSFPKWTPHALHLLTYARVEESERGRK